MKAIRTTILSIALAGIGFSIAPTPVQAQGVFNGAISNPFVFCSLPKPCKKCQPFRKIYEQICPAGKPSPQAQQQYQEAIAANPALATTAISPEQFQAQLTPAIKSAYDDVVPESEVDQYINWLSRQPVPPGTAIPKNTFNGADNSCSSNSMTMADYWCAQGITNPLSDQSIRSKSLNVIKQTNENIVASVSGGKIPQSPKPWFGLPVSNY